MKPRPKPRAPLPSPPATSSAGSGGPGEFDFGDLGTAGSAPYLPPSPGSGGGGPYAPPRPYGGSGQIADRSPALYIIPGVFILLWSLLLILSSISRMGVMVYVLATQEVHAQAYSRVILFFVLSLVVLTIGIAMASGSINMIRRTGLTNARTTAIMALIPCLGGCVFPIGIWATVLLFTGSVKKDFYD